jgi:RNA recognition motif-containing protein
MNIYVGNLSLEMTEEELRREFMAFGEVISVTIMNDKYIGSGQSRGYAFVEMPSDIPSSDLPPVVVPFFKLELPES